MELRETGQKVATVDSCDDSKEMSSCIKHW
jgi:hypothetical protein